MDRIIIQLSADGVTANRIFLSAEPTVQSGVITRSINHTIHLADQSDAFKAAFAQLVALAEAKFDQLEAPNQPVYDVEVAISADPDDATITRKAFANIPMKQGDNVFVMPVLIRHYQNGTHIKRQKPDFVVNLRASDERKLTIDGQEVGEYTHFYNLAKQHPIITLMSQQILAEDAQGRFNPAPVVGDQPE